ncbi:MAG: C40 family peptidase [Flavobacteriales bacterium]
MVVVCTAVSALGQADTLAVDTLIIVEVKALYSEMDSTLADSVVSYARLFIGKPYAYGSTSGKSFDCSGYTQFVFSKHDIQLARSSSSQAEQCEKIKPRKASKGDLIFFTGRNSKSKNVGHVGIVTEVDGDRIRMIHATVHGGVMEEWYNDSDYFRKRMLFVGRIAK